ncbi:MAG: mechanosensitive ion channel family protein, partial [Thermoleophilia bacterium]|nr:mechanosensitive ion channel family protein [Thermoleophilia bacterium]
MKIVVRSRPPLARLALAIALVIPALAAAAQEAPPPTSQAEPAPPSRPAGPTDDLERGVPRTAMKGYLQACRDGDFERAARYLDLSRLSPAERSERGPELARRLEVVLDQKLWVDWELLSDDPDGERDDGLSASRDRVGSIETSMGPVPVLLQRVPREDGTRIWKIASATVAAIPDLYDEFGYGPLEELLPDWLLSVTLLELALWQWLAVLVLAVLAGVLSWLVVFALFRIAGPLVARSRTDFDDRLLRATAGPLRLLAAVGVFAAGTAPLGFGLRVQRFFDGLERGLVIVAVAWFLLKIANVVTLVAWSRLRERGDQATAAVVPLGQKAVKVVILLVATLAILDSFGLNVTALVAGLGVGGIAVALAAQKTIENLFGGVTVLADKPVSVGDFCRFGDRVGTVEEIGLRSTRVRTLDRT